MTSPILHLTQVTKVPLLDRSGDRLGRVKDLLVRISDGGYPPVIGITAHVSGRDVFLPAEQIADIAPGHIKLARDRVHMRRFERRPGEVLLRTDVLGRRLINLTGAHLVRANEIELARIGDAWCAVGIDSSFGALMRRILPKTRRKPPSRPVLDWMSVRPFLSHVPGAGDGVPTTELTRLHPAQIADLIEAASHEEGQEIMDAVKHDSELEADVFEEMDVEHQLEFIEKRSDDDAASLIGRMAPDDAADLIMELEQDRRLPVLERLPVTHQRKVRTLLGFHPSTAGGAMGLDFMCLDARTAVGAAITAVRDSELSPEALATVFVHDVDGRLTGAVPLVRLLQRDDEDLLSEMVDQPPPHMEADRDISDVGVMMSDYNLTIVPIVDDQDRMIGVVTVDDVLETLIPGEWKRRAEALGEG
jgi:CBS domain-containing protein